MSENYRTEQEEQRPVLKKTQRKETGHVAGQDMTELAEPAGSAEPAKKGESGKTDRTADLVGADEYAAANTASSDSVTAAGSTEAEAESEAESNAEAGAEAESESESESFSIAPQWQPFYRAVASAVEHMRKK